MAGIDVELAIRWLILLMVMTCDPLAIALTVAASGSRSDGRQQDIKAEHIHTHEAGQGVVGAVSGR